MKEINYLYEGVIENGSPSGFGRLIKGTDVFVGYLKWS